MRVIALLALVVVALSEKVFETPGYHDSVHTKVFKRWKQHFGIKYVNLEQEAHKFTVFMDNWRMIHEHNEKKLDWTLGLNQFADMTGEEFKLYVHGHEGSCLTQGQKTLQQLKPGKPDVNAPTSIDWQAQGKVTKVKNQGRCGSCWAFSTTGSIESRVAIATGNLVSLSEQQLVDCSRSYGNMGCSGGLMDNAFRYVKAVGGLCSESKYPYTAKDGTCKAATCGTKYDKITGYQDVPHDSESSLVTAVAKGPVSIAIEADQSAFQFYRSGVFSGTCGTRLDHGVLIVGYGTMNGADYWKVKNSWGGSWGDQGYIYICRNCNKNAGSGECGILREPSYPIA